jgi:hypothetical protein
MCDVGESVKGKIVALITDIHKIKTYICALTFLIPKSKRKE